VVSSSINWASLEKATGSRPGSAHCALAEVLGDANLRAAVDVYLTFQGGWIVAESVVRHLQSDAAHDRAVEIWRSDLDVERRRGSLEILGDVVRIGDLSLIGELLSDPDPLVAWRGVHCVTQLAYGSEFGEPASRRYLDYLSAREDDLSPQLDQELGFVSEFLATIDPAVRLRSESPQGCSQFGQRWTEGPCVESIDWDRVSETLSTGGFGGTWVAQMALELIIGEDRFREAVDSYVDGTPGANLIRLVLDDVQPPSAGRRCIEIFRSQRDLQQRLSAVSLLCLIAVNDQLYIVEELLDDPNPAIQESGAVVLEKLVESQRRWDPDPEPFIALAETHSNERVRQKAHTIRSEWIDWP
jgi:hypothetical protein